MSDVPYLANETPCIHCGMPLRGWAGVPEGPVCHPDGDYTDCYRLVTVYRHPTPCNCDGFLRPVPA